MRKFGLLFAAVWSLQAPWVHAEPTSLEERIAREELWKSNGLFLLPYRPNYILPFSYNGRPNMSVYSPDTKELDKIETKFQISVKIPLADRLFHYDIGTYIAYTQVSYWQSYNSDRSSAFRSTDYEPEFFLQFNRPHSLGPATNRYNRLGYAHQSNGQTGDLSRSWNRLYAEFVVDYRNAYLSLKPWYRLSGPEATDSNPDTWKYLGYGELRGAMNWKNRNEISFMWRNNLRTPDNKGAIELNWAFPIITRMGGYVQYFNGYGESLLDYNYPVSRLSFGVSFSNWL